MLPSGCLPLRIRRYVQKSKLIILVLTAMSWLAAVSLSGTDRLIVGIFLFPSLPLIPFAGHLWIPVVKKIQGKGEKIESSGYRFLWYLSVFLTNLVLAILLAAGICLAGYTLVEMLTSENTGIDGIGTALILVFAVWTAALTVFLIAMLPQLQMLMVAVLRMMKKLRALLTTG